MRHVCRCHHNGVGALQPGFSYRALGYARQNGCALQVEPCLCTHHGGDRLRLRDEVGRLCPDCKVLLLVDENADRALAANVLQAKKDGRIDNFIYASVSPTYLAAVLDTL